MKKILRSNTYLDDNTFAPTTYLMYYDSNFKIFEVRVRLGVVIICKLNSMDVLDEQQESDLIDDIMKHSTILEKNELNITDVNVYDIEKEYLDNLNYRITIEGCNELHTN